MSAAERKVIGFDIEDCKVGTYLHLVQERGTIIKYFNKTEDDECRPVCEVQNKQGLIYPVDPFTKVRPATVNEIKSDKYWFKDVKSGFNTGVIFATDLLERRGFKANEVESWRTSFVDSLKKYGLTVNDLKVPEATLNKLGIKLERGISM